MSTVERMTYLTQFYDEPELSHVLNVVSKDAVTVIADELSHAKMKEEGTKMDNDQEAINIMITVVDELADRIKAEVRYRINLSEKVKKREKGKKNE